MVGAVDLLGKLYDRVVVPTAVLEELRHRSAPPEVRAWAASLPAWIAIKSPAHTETELNLGFGELQAIALAEESKADAVLLDDRQARRVAEARHLPVAGTVGALEQAAAAGLLDLRMALGRLRRTNFRGDERLFADAINRVESRRRKR